MNNNEIQESNPATENPVEIVTNTVPNPETDVTEEEKELLERSERPVSADGENVQKLALDNTDGEDPLNESGNPGDMGEDLDVPGAELDDENQEIGEEDEENNAFTDRDQ